MATIFSETLKRLRREAGFPTAYRFYHNNGGAMGLKLSYRKYLAMEQGKILPVFERLCSLISGLKVLRLSETGNELVLSWLKTMAGEEAYESLLAPILSVKQGTGSFSTMQKAVKHALSGKKYHLSVAQFNVISETRDNYLCFTALVNDDSRWSPEELSKFMELTPAVAAKAMEALAKVKILKKHSGGRYSCPLCGKMIEYPHVDMLGPDKFRKLSEYLGELTEKGRTVWARIGTVRADYDALGDFLQLMQLNISTADSYAITRRTGRSGLFAIKGSVVKIRDF